MSIAQHMRQAEFYREVLQDEAKRIARSSETRSFLMKNLADGDAEELLGAAVVCIADLTGDKTLIKALRRRTDEQQGDI